MMQENLSICPMCKTFDICGHKSYHLDQYCYIFVDIVTQNLLINISLSFVPAIKLAGYLALILDIG